MNIYRGYMKDQLGKLLTQFGRIDELFLDFSYPGKEGKGHEDWDSEGLVRLARKLQPQIIINNRADLGHTDWGWDYITPKNCLMTYHPEKHRLYIHVLEWPFKSLHLPGLKDKIEYVQLLHDASEIKFRTQVAPGSHMTEISKENDVILSLPVERPDVEVPVIEVFLK